MGNQWRLVCAVLLAAGLVACSSVPAPAERSARAQRLAVAAGLRPAGTAATPLPMRAFARIGCPGEAVHVYIEGDGLAWLSVSTPSPDPTPVEPVALLLAVADTTCNVVYLGRPGQYGAGAVAPRYWLGARFAPEVVDSYVAVLAELVPPPVPLRLAGFSGGGAVAALVAARFRAEARAVSLVTVAGNLEPGAWARRRKLTPLGGSLSPADAAALLADVPQVHFTGRSDRQVPAWVLDAYLERLPHRGCVRVESRQAAHTGPWDDVVAVLAARPPACAGVPAGGP